MTRRATTDVFEIFFTPRFPLFFIVGALLLAVMGNSLSDLLKLHFGEGIFQLVLIFFIATATLGVLVYSTYNYVLWRARREYGVIDKPNPPKKQGIIAFASLTQKKHLEKALDYHADTLKRVWLITSEGAGPTAIEIKQKYEKRDLLVYIVPLKDQWDLLESKSLVESIYTDHIGSLEEENVIADFTGGTKPMTAGMIFACMKPPRTLQYVPAHYNAGDARSPLNPIEYRLDYRSSESSGRSFASSATE